MHVIILDCILRGLNLIFESAIFGLGVPVPTWVDDDMLRWILQF